MQTNFRRGDLKYYYWVHCDKQKALGNIPVSYSNFVNRLKKLNLHDAIYKPRVDFQVRDANKTPIQDAVRRRQINKEENIQILDFEAIEKVLFTKRTPMVNTIKMPKPRKTLFQRIIEWIKRK